MHLDAPGWRHVLEVYVTGTDELHLSGSTEAVSGVGDAAAFDVSVALVFERDGAYWVVQILTWAAPPTWHRMMPRSSWPSSWSTASADRSPGTRRVSRAREVPSGRSR